jgi:hypothetical protein
MQNRIKTGKFLLAVFAFVFVAVLFSSCDRKKEYTIEYEVTGTAAKADISLNNAEGDLEHYSNVALPYSKSFRIKLKRDYDFFYAAISALSKSPGTIRCVIYKDGRVFRQDEATSIYFAYVSASGTIEY